ncbi:DUF6968 family protein [Undibacterium terreum]|uniref:DUF6968 domain-containing protein n=1 Tax=Undibacterium terreum TaxID=1224302 RepID=A0A916UA44_9BURK|nr:hypothetical protein [Undibacterium terreum]GGC64757.1 hypothetical protein GCM10011396_09710 [Undibacterium terreum]
MKGHELKIENPSFIATEEILWIRADGTEVLIQAALGMPYQLPDSWACPVALSGVDERYPDIVGESSMQSLHLAMRLIRQRLGHLFDAGEILVHPRDRTSRWDLTLLNAIFGSV